jgi:hypothetical protein
MSEIEFVEKFKVMGDFIGDRKEHANKYTHWQSRFKMVREPDNEHDPNAILIKLAVRNGKHFLDMGYMPKDLAAEVAPKVDAGESFKVTFRTKIVDDSGRYHGLYLNLNRVVSE